MLPISLSLPRIVGKRHATPSYKKSCRALPRASLRLFSPCPSSLRPIPPAALAACRPSFPLASSSPLATSIVVSRYEWSSRARQLVPSIGRFGKGGGGAASLFTGGKPQGQGYQHFKKDRFEDDRDSWGERFVLNIFVIVLPACVVGYYLYYLDR